GARDGGRRAHDVRTPPTPQPLAPEPVASGARGCGHVRAGRPRGGTQIRFSAGGRLQSRPAAAPGAAPSPPPVAMPVGVAPVVLLPPGPPRTPPVTVQASERVRGGPEQWTVMSYGPGRASELMVAVPREVPRWPL